MGNLLEKVIWYFLIYVCSLPGYIILGILSRIFDWFSLYHPNFLRHKNNPARHHEKLQKVQTQYVVEIQNNFASEELSLYLFDLVKLWNSNGRKSRMCTARPAWQSLSLRNADKIQYTQIQLDSLDEIIEIDENKKILHVEPGIKMGTLTHQLLPMGWTIPVVPELESLTIGGCVNGAGIETTSHKYGLFAETCLEFEIVLADGTIKKCSRETDADLYYAIPMSHGTLGFLTAVTIPLLPAPKYVKIEYFPLHSISEAIILMEKSLEYEFIEGIMFGMDKIVIMLGVPANAIDEHSKVNSLNSWYKPWFFKHVEGKLKEKEVTVEYVPVRDYYHRHQRSYFWEISYTFPFGNLTLIRFLFGWMYPANFQLTKLLCPQYLRNLLLNDTHILQDFIIPISKLDNALRFSHVEVEVYPIWLCLYKSTCLSPLTNEKQQAEEIYVDIGIYGKSKISTTFDVEEKTRKLEKFVMENIGYQALYADTYLTREEFRTMFNLKHYDMVRKRLRCHDAFPDLYDKVSRAARSL